MKLILKITTACIIIITSWCYPLKAQTRILFENPQSMLPEGIAEVTSDHSSPFLFNQMFFTNKSATSVYKYSKVESFRKKGTDSEWELSSTYLYDYDDSGNVIREWEKGDSEDFSDAISYSLNFYDEQNRENRSEFYFNYNDEGIKMLSYTLKEYLTDFPLVESSILSYGKAHKWDPERNDWKYYWDLQSGIKRDYTLSRKTPNHYEKKVDYTYDPYTKKWVVSGYKYDYVVNAKGLITETLVYQATNEDENKWPLILHVKHLINDNSVVFRSDRIHYQTTTPYIERWSNIQWDKHDGNMQISGYSITGSNRIKSATIEYLLASDPSTEYMQSRTFTCDYQNDNSYHYIINDSSGNILVDNCYYKENNYSLQEVWQGYDYQMQYYDIDNNHNYATYDHYVHKKFYEGEDNVITEKDWHRYTSREYYQDTDEISVSEHYEYDALSDTEPYDRSRTVYSNFKKFNTGIDSVLDDENNQETLYYNLQGVLIQRPQAGQLVIRKQGRTTDKIIYR